jgi:hypothetical protein
MGDAQNQPGIESSMTAGSGGDLLATLNLLFAHPSFSSWLGKSIRQRDGGDNAGKAILAMKFAFLHSGLFARLVKEGMGRIEDIERFFHQRHGDRPLLTDPTSFGVSSGGKPSIVVPFDPQRFVMEACMRGNWDLGEIPEFPELRPETVKGFQELGGFMPVFFPARSQDELAQGCQGFRPLKFPNYPNGEPSKVDQFPLSINPAGTWRMIEVRQRPAVHNDPKGYGEDDKVPGILGLQSRRGCSPRQNVAWNRLQTDGLKPVSEKLGGVNVRLLTLEEWNFTEFYLRMLHRVFGTGPCGFGEHGIAEWCANIQHLDAGNPSYVHLGESRYWCSCFDNQFHKNDKVEGIGFRLIADLT